jgi:hypothetical protein
MALSRPGKTEPRVVIGKRDDVAPHAIEKVLHRVKKPPTLPERSL